MKKHLFLVAALVASMAVNAQYTQELPLDYSDFFRADAIAEDGEHLEKAEYAEGTTQSAETFQPNQWNLTGKAGSRGNNNPAIETSTLSWNTYIDNEKGKAIIYNGEVTETRVSIYSLKRNNDYSSADGSKSYYLAALVNFTQVSSSGGVDFISFDGNFTATTARARVAAKKGTNSSSYHLGMEYASTPTADGTTWSAELTGGETHLIVVKITPNTNKTTEDIEAASLWLDPDLAKSEAENDAAKIVSLTGKGIGSVRGIDIVQKKNITGKVAGLRFSDNWADVVKAGPDDPTAIDEVNAGVKARKVFKDGQMLIERNGELYNMTGAKVL